MHFNWKLLEQAAQSGIGFALYSYLEKLQNLCARGITGMLLVWNVELHQWESYCITGMSPHLRYNQFR